MIVTIDEVKRLAKLSMLEFSNEETKKFIGEFTQILNFVDEVKNAKIDENIKIEETPKTMADLREDIPIIKTDVEKFVQLNAPECENGAFVVPVVVE